MKLLDDRRNIVVIGTSAGGVEALSKLLGFLPAEFDAVILVVLHVSPSAPSQLDGILAKRTSLRVRPARDGDELQPGTVFTASADRHLMVMRDGIRLTRGPKESRSRPAVDVLFRSAAVAYGSRVIGVVLTGALDDGTAGLWAIKDHGGLAFVQDPDEASFSSMPQSAIEQVQIDCVGTLRALADRLATEVLAPASWKRRTDSDAERARTEVAIALEGNGMAAGIMDLGPVSKYTCPDCHGVLVQIKEGTMVRFRCHTGHAFSPVALMEEVNAEIDNGLWDAIRSVEERILLIRQLAEMHTKVGRMANAERFEQQAADAESRLKALRDLVLDPGFFGHAPDE
ncbi:chemotaxis protein CheB [Pseudoduganella umbonata]|uniref:protein-glutamate methylesterase n=1 Tax=Pseudoduganella umbonata TaxID=864828 RepID=A0A7W5HCI4_9BURK|nr:chemotaxis protein CheB [Pseudoduganella umbonata]MBB3221623.1 two-component system chemotaxis response regulator CheB [Pseudoduganella umbonata]